MGRIFTPLGILGLICKIPTPENWLTICASSFFLLIDQFQRLQYLLKEERRQYRTSLRKEHEAELMSIQKQPKETPEDKIAYDQLKALNHYNKPAGKETNFFKLREHFNSLRAL